MADFDNRLARATTTTAGYDAGLRAHMLRVYNYMTGALALSGAVAYAVANTPAVLALFYHQVMTQQGLAMTPTILGWVAFVAPLAFVFFLSFRIQQMSVGTAQLSFWAYAGAVGISLASIFLLYTGASIATTFFVTAATFGVMSLWGYTTARDLTGFGNFLFMGLIGVVIASLVNIFFQSAAFNFAISVIGVLVFVGLVAWDTQKIKQYYYAVGSDGAMAGKAAIMGALALYLDFLNIFLFLLRFMGSRR